MAAVLVWYKVNEWAVVVVVEMAAAGRREKVSFSSKKSLVCRRKLGKGRSALGAFRARLLGGES